jgi:O-antigen/teichoic acid export membrane protein
MNLRRSLLISVLSRYALLVLGVVSSAIIARLLNPKEMGAFSLAMVLLSYAAIFRDFGASTYLTQAKELNEQKLRATMGLQLLAGALLAGIVILLGQPLSNLYGEPVLSTLIFWVALSYLVSPFGTVTQALLLRDMKFDAIARIQIGASVAAAIVSVALAWLGFGALSLAIGHLASVVASVLLTLPYRPAGLPWLPSLRGSREILGFGGTVTSTAFINVTVKGAPEMLLGKLQGLYSVGLFARGQGMVIMFGRQLTDAVSSVALPNFAKLARDGGDLGGAFLHGTAYVCAVAWASCAVIAVLADPLIAVLYGPQWHEAIPLVRWVAGAYGAGLSVMLVSSALSACGEVKPVAWATLRSGVITVAAATVGALQNLEALSIGLFIAGLVHLCIFMRLAQAVLKFRWADLADAMWRSAIVAAGCGVPPLLLVLVPKPAPWQAFIELVGGLALATAGFCAAVIVARHPLRRELGMLAEKGKAYWSRSKAATPR